MVQATAMRMCVRCGTVPVADRGHRTAGPQRTNCDACRLRRAQHRAAPVVDGIRTCKKCLVTKPVTEFYANHLGRGGRESKCMACHATLARKHHLLRSFGLTPEAYNAMFTAQDGCCKICQRHQSEFKRPLSVDHDHATGKVRALLCDCCNNMLGKAQDDPAVLRDGATYLEMFAKGAT